MRLRFAVTAPAVFALLAGCSAASPAPPGPSAPRPVTVVVPSASPVAPSPEPAFSMPPPATDASDEGGVTVTPGAYCSDRGTIGHSARGVRYVCAPDSSGRLRWRRP